MTISIWKLLLILLIVLVIFGAGRLPKVMEDVGKSLKGLKDGLKMSGDDEEKEKPTEKAKISSEVKNKSPKKKSVAKKKKATKK